jgi:hypothetical protein
MSFCACLLEKYYFRSSIIANAWRIIITQTMLVDAIADAVFERAAVINWIICRIRRITSVPAMIVLT